MTPLLSVESSIIYICLIIALYPVQHSSTLSSVSSRPFHPTLQDYTKERVTSQQMPQPILLSLSNTIYQTSVSHTIPKRLDCIGVPSSWFSLPISISTSQMLPVTVYPPSSMSMFQQHIMRYFVSRSLLSSSLTPTSSSLSVILVY